MGVIPLKVTVDDGWIALTCPCGEVWIAALDRPGTVGTWMVCAVDHVSKCQNPSPPVDTSTS